MEFVLLVAAGATLVGSAIGAAIRRYMLRRLRKSRTQKPEYNIEEDISPAEFGYIIEGKVGAKELIAELIWLHNKGFIQMARDASGKVIATSKLKTNDRLPNVDQVLMKVIFRGGFQPVVVRDVVATMQPIIEFAALDSLNKKGWVKTTRPYLRGGSIMPAKYILGATGVVLVACALIYVAGLVFGLASEFLSELYMLTFTAAFILGAICLLVVVVRGEALTSAGMMMHTTDTYKENWHKVNGVYDYLRVSGNDIFTPDYQTLAFQKVDKLYPYAVAAGLDKKVLRIL